ncbi:hypothetical protein GCM10011591_12810 [Nocardia camponoti]|uniref:Uncharacterized protein n=2 Tax=Nocardia camponoti TaxID=1616106 RepID=A0A917QC65_9NOCA|nr:hypothetical protein GCM10011591_12810 [Nocardia camponoti]
MYCLAFAIVTPGSYDWEAFLDKAFQNLPREERRDGAPCYDSIAIGCHWARGLLWRDRLGELPPDMPFPEPPFLEYDRNEARRIADVAIDERFFPTPHGYFTPDAAYHPVDQYSRNDWWTFRSTVLTYPDHLLIPLACHC